MRFHIGNLFTVLFLKSGAEGRWLPECCSGQIGEKGRDKVPCLPRHNVVIGVGVFSLPVTKKKSTVSWRETEREAPLPFYFPFPFFFPSVARRNLYGEKVFFIRFSQFGTASASHYPPRRIVLNCQLMYQFKTNLAEFEVLGLS